MASALSSRSTLRLSAPKAFSRRGVLVQAKLATKKATKANYVCVDCGYLYDGKQGPFEELPKGYTCPVCGADKKRFKKYEGNVSRSNDNKTMAKRRDDLRAQLEARGESVGEDASFLLATAASAAVFLGAVYYFTAIAR
mmetsp:Transcript_31684/g.54804  ORF Transcript_31684/g.54804 Transcript_31684/m.54804 type:complete len:139 (-) Transcript_31684:84-500(-)